jgi:hypothetical protein
VPFKSASVLHGITGGFGKFPYKLFYPYIILIKANAEIQRLAPATTSVAHGCWRGSVFMFES